MTAIPAVVMFGLLVALVLIAVQQASNGLQDATHAADGGYTWDILNRTLTT